MAVKSHLRNNLPIVIAPATINGLGSNAENIGKLLNRKYYFFVPFRQDNPITKPRSPVFTKIGFYKLLVIACCGEEVLKR